MCARLYSSSFPPWLLLVLEIVVDLCIGDQDLAVDFALLEACNQYFVAQLVAETVEVHAVAFQRLAKRVGRKFVLLRDAFQRALQLGVVHPQSGLPGGLHQYPGGNQPLQQLALQQVLSGQWSALAPQLLQRHLHLFIEIEPRDDFVVDHRHHAIEN